MDAAPPSPNLAVSRALVASAIGRLTDAHCNPTVCRIQTAVRDHDGVGLSFLEIIEAKVGDGCADVGTGSVWRSDRATVALRDRPV
ncbi:MAG TPA: hypothetical protein VGL95_04465 [Acetobacteraceae bacterium]|jgi:hypothetical protein